MRFMLVALTSAALAAAPSPAAAQHGGKQNLDSVAFVREFPLAFVYEGIARFHAKDYPAAIGLWESYLKKAGKGSDTAWVNSMIHQAVIQEYPEALVYEGLARVKQGDSDGAIRSWDEFQKIAPPGSDTATVARMSELVFFQTYPLARLYQGVAYYLSNDFNGAIGSWQKYLAHCTNDGERRQVRELIIAAKERLNDETIAEARIR